MASFGTRFDYPLDAPSGVFPADFANGVLLSRHAKALIFYPDGTTQRANVAWADGVAKLDAEVPPGATVSVYRETEPEHTLAFFRPGQPISAASLNLLSKQVRMRLHELRDLAAKKPPLVIDGDVLLTTASGAALVQIGVGWVRGALQSPDLNWVDPNTISIVGADRSSGQLGHRFATTERRYAILRIDRVSPWQATQTGFEYGVYYGASLDAQAAAQAGGAPCSPLQYTTAIGQAKRGLVNTYESAYYHGGGYTSFGPDDGMNTPDSGGQSFLILLSCNPINASDCILRRYAWRIDTGVNPISQGNSTLLVGAQTHTPDMGFFCRSGGDLATSNIRQIVVPRSRLAALGLSAAAGAIAEIINRDNLLEVT